MYDNMIMYTLKSYLSQKTIISRPRGNLMELESRDEAAAGPSIIIFSLYVFFSPVLNGSGAFFLHREYNIIW